jgi:hypothetical protein
MFYHFTIRIEPENINSCYAPVIGIIIIQIKKIYMCPHPVATCNTMMHYYTQIFPRSTTIKELAQGFSRGRNYEIMLYVVRHTFYRQDIYAECGNPNIVSQVNPSV